MSALSPVEQQIVMLTVSADNSCSYCVGAHSAVAKMVRMPDDVLQRLEFLVRRGVSQEDLDGFTAAGYTQRLVLDVITLLAMKTLSNGTNHLANTPLDSQFAAQSWSHERVVGA